MCDELLDRIENLELMVMALSDEQTGLISPDTVKNMTADFFNSCKSYGGIATDAEGISVGFRVANAYDVDDRPELAPCPFCGDPRPFGPTHITDSDSVHPIGWVIECTDCNCLMEGLETERAAFENWNGREET